MKTYDYLIVGCGLTGAVIANNIATTLKKNVLIIDKRNTIAGNIYDYKDANSIFVHKYGPHAFHTNNKEVWTYLSNFTDWIPYSHKVNAVIGSNEVNIPFNFNSIKKVYTSDEAEALINKLILQYGEGNKVSILELMKNSDSEIKKLAQFVYNNVFEGYTTKQWGISPSEIDPSVMSRVPVVLSYDDRYFQDEFQAIPKNGYTAMIEKMLDNSLIEVKLNTQFNDIKNLVNYEKLVYTGSIDEYFDYKFGNLPYRSLHFNFKEIEEEFFQSLAQVNYPNTEEYTRITEFKHFTGVKSNKSIIAYEYSQLFEKDVNERYYPISNKDNNALYQKYADEKTENIIFLGRLGEYKYYNMDQAVARALEVFKNKIK